MNEVNIVKERAIIDRKKVLSNLDMTKLKHEHTKSLMHDVQLENDILQRVLFSRGGKRSITIILMSKVPWRNKSRSRRRRVFIPVKRLGP